MKANVIFEIIGPIEESDLMEWARQAARNLEVDTNDDVAVDDITIEELPL